jgi:hypothetical protein
MARFFNRSCISHLSLQHFEMRELVSRTHSAMNTYGGSGGITPRILGLGARWRCPGRFTSGEGTPNIHWIWGWVGLRAGVDVVAKRQIPSRCRESNPARLARSLVAIPTELSQLLFHFYKIKIHLIRFVTYVVCSHYLDQSMEFSSLPVFWLKVCMHLSSPACVLHSNNIW